MKEIMSDVDITILLILIIISIFSIRFMVFNYRNYRKMKARMKELDEKKCDGPHKWIYMSVGDESINVCSECCWSPIHEGYIKREFVKATIAQKKFMESLEKYTNKTLEELGVSEELYDKIINIKKDFMLQHLDKAIEELKNGE